MSCEGLLAFSCSDLDVTVCCRQERGQGLQSKRALCSPDIFVGRTRESGRTQDFCRTAMLHTPLLALAVYCPDASRELVCYHYTL